MLNFYFRVLYIGIPAMTHCSTVPVTIILVLCNCENIASQLAMHAMDHVNYLLDGKSFLSVSDVLLSVSSAVMKVDKQLLPKKMHTKPLYINCLDNN